MENNKRHYLYSIKSISEKDGLLSVLEEKKDVPFKIKRVFYEYRVSEDASRGEHANKKSRFCLIALSGSCEVIVNDGRKETQYLLDAPNKVLYLDKMIWKTMKHYSKDCILLVLSDSLYDSNEYIRDFNEYKELIKNVK